MAPKKTPASKSDSKDATKPTRKTRSTKEAGSGAAEKKDNLRLNWNRVIHINTKIDDALLKELTPTILKLRQESNNPISVGIDSPGGSVAVMKAILGLMKTPDQNKKRPAIYTVVTNRAYSAAANLLALGDYSLAFPHSWVFYHDVLYPTIEEVTPAKALRTAGELERGNLESALTLANAIRGRFVWVYLMLIPKFGEVRKTYANLAAEFDKEFAETLPQDEKRVVDIVGLALTLFNELSGNVSSIPMQALRQLNSWMKIDEIERRLSGKRRSEEKPIDIIKGIDDLVAEIRRSASAKKASADLSKPIQIDGLSDRDKRDVTLLLEVIAKRFATDQNFRVGEDGLDSIRDEFSFIKDANSSQHIKAIVELMIENEFIFFGREIAGEINRAKPKEMDKILTPVYPQAQMFRFFLVLLCKCLCSGENLLTPQDAQLLGIVDEVLGGDALQNIREWKPSKPVQRHEKN